MDWRRPILPTHHKTIRSGVLILFCDFAAYCTTSLVFFSFFRVSSVMRSVLWNYITSSCANISLPHSSKLWMCTYVHHLVINELPATRPAAATTTTSASTPSPRRTPSTTYRYRPDYNEGLPHTHALSRLLSTFCLMFHCKCGFACVTWRQDSGYVQSRSVLFAGGAVSSSTN